VQPLEHGKPFEWLQKWYCMSGENGAAGLGVNGLTAPGNDSSTDGDGKKK
jgi:hypothetical protein